jgi:aminopeptidase-like protein
MSGLARVRGIIVMSKAACLTPLIEDDAIGKDIYALAAEIFPICRSITGDGVRQTIDVLAQHIPIQRHELPTGTPVLGWTVPKEWSITEAYIKNSQGERVVDFQRSNLHVVNYSAPVRQRMQIFELKRHVFTLPDQPDLIPYRTSFYKEEWGFCMSHQQLEALEAAGGEYEVVIASRLEPGALTWGEYLCVGESTDEVLISTHICHPSLANDNCSGLALVTMLARELSRRQTRLSYRFVFVPSTIGSISWLATNEATLSRIKHGVVISNVGDAGAPTYKRSRRGNSLVDRAFSHVLKRSGSPFNLLDFVPYGYDERQYCSPGFDLPVGLFQRSQFGTFPEYHTSADDLDFIRPEHLAASFRWIVQALEILERDRRLLNLFPKGEPQLGKFGLYSSFGSGKDAMTRTMAVLWTLNLSDGRHSLLDIAERADLPFDLISAAASALESHGLLSASQLGEASAQER